MIFFQIVGIIFCGLAGLLALALVSVFCIEKIIRKLEVAWAVAFFWAHRQGAREWLKERGL